MTSLKEKLETIDTYYNTINIFPDTEQRKLEDYKNVLETYRNYKIVNDVCERKTTLTDEVDRILGLVTEKYNGFLNFWKPCRNTDTDYNREIENLEKILGKTYNLKTGENKAKAIAKYAGREIVSDAAVVILSIMTFSSFGSILIDIPGIYSLNSTIYNMIGFGLAGFSLGIGGFAKWMLMPQVANRNAREEEKKKIKEDAKFIQSVIEKIYSK